MNWESELDRRLKALPGRRAPAGLAAAVLLRAKPWHKRPWWTWSPAGRAAFVVSTAASVALLWLAARPVVQHLDAQLGWTLTVAAGLGRLLGPAAFALAALAALPAAGLAYIKEKA